MKAYSGTAGTHLHAALISARMWENDEVHTPALSFPGKNTPKIHWTWWSREKFRPCWE